MYREEPDDPNDSGWRIFAGDESQEYADDASRTGIYDVNTIANCDPDINRFLEAPVGTFCARDGGPLEPVEE